MAQRAICDNCGAEYELADIAATGPGKCECGHRLRVVSVGGGSGDEGDGGRGPLNLRGGGGGMLQFRSRLTLPDTVPMTTMADVAFLLIIFFLLTSTFARDTGLDVTLPKAMTSEQLPKRKITIWVTAQGRMRVNENWINPRDLSAVLSRELETTSLKAVTIRGDEGVPYGTIIAVMDTVKRLGAGITLAAEVEQEAGDDGGGGGGRE